MIEVLGEVGSAKNTDNQKTVVNSIEETVEEKENRCNQVQINTLQINQEIKNTYLKRNGSR
jgi:hypothetical protein